MAIKFGSIVLIIIAVFIAKLSYEEFGEKRPQARYPAQVYPTR